MKFPTLQRLAEGDVIRADFGKKKVLPTPDAEKIATAMSGARVLKKGEELPAGAKEVSMMQAFGSDEMNALNDVGIKLTEKPTYWDDFEGNGYAVKRNIHDLTLKKAEKAIGKKFPVANAKDFYGGRDPRGPLVKFDKEPHFGMGILKFENGNRYLVDTSQASTYIRMWQKIN
jgi:hypothetical protein